MAGTWKEALVGTPDVTKQLPRFRPEQESAMSQLLQYAMPQLTSNRFDFGPIEEQARAGFEQKTIPSIAERLTQMGQGARYSSAANQLMGEAGTDLERSLAAMKQQYGLQQQGQLMNLLGMGLTPSFENIYMPQTGGFLGGMAPGFGTGLGQSFGQALPGMATTAAGTLGSALGGWFGGTPGATVGGEVAKQGTSTLLKLLSYLIAGQRQGE